MDLSGNTVLVTGGGSGIGLAIAERFLDAGSEVIICGRREDKLREAQTRHPKLHIRTADVASQAGREELIAWPERQQEIAINFEAPVHLCSLILAHLREQPRAAIVNISSGLAFVPGLFAPVYSATKAAMHSFSLSLRGEVASTSIEVVEIAPPAVNTDLGGVGIHTEGALVDEFADSVMQRVADGKVEVGFAGSEERRLASRDELDDCFQRMNAPFME